MTNKDILISICKKEIHREGIDSFMNWLEESDFFTAPASTKYHGNYEGGLCEHSINVYNQLVDLCGKYCNNLYTLETIAIAALFHDICKVNFYKKGTRNIKDENGMWVAKQIWEIDEKIPLGHGEKSCIILQSYMKLIVSVDAIEKERQIDLLAFCKWAKIDTDWQYTASKFNQLMCLRAAKELGADVKNVGNTYFLQDAVKKIEMGATPTSNSQVCKLLQRVIDEMLPNENAEGQQIYKVNNYDVRYLDDLYGKKSNKQRITIRVSNDSFLRRILVDICYRLVTGGMYGVDGYKEVKA